MQNISSNINITNHINIRNFDVCKNKYIIKIKQIAITIFETIKNIIAFPLRYLGSKTWSLPVVASNLFTSLYEFIFKGKAINNQEKFGINQEYSYRRFFNKELSSDEAKSFIQYGCMAAAVHSNEPNWITPFGYKLIIPKEISGLSDCLPLSLKAKDTCFYDNKTGLKLSLYEKGNKILIGFGPFASSDTEESVKHRKKAVRNQIVGAGVKNIAGGLPNLYTEANDFLTHLRALPRFKDKNIELCGQSIAGSIASYVALKQKIKAVCMNSLPMGVGLQQSIGSKNLRQADKYVTQIIARDDILADLPKIAYGIDAVINFIGIRTPGNFGHKVYVPSAYKNWAQNHRFLLGSLFAHAGYDKRTKPWLIGEENRALDVFNPN